MTRQQRIFRYHNRGVDFSKLGSLAPCPSPEFLQLFLPIFPLPGFLPLEHSQLGAQPSTLCSLFTPNYCILLSKFLIKLLHYLPKLSFNVANLKYNFFLFWLRLYDYFRLKSDLQFINKCPVILMCKLLKG